MKKWIVIGTLMFGILFSNRTVTQSSNEVTIGFTGDVMLGRMVNEALKQKSFDFPWGNMLSYLQANDFNFVNLETAITKHEQAAPKVFNFKTDPKNIKSLILANIAAVSLANNHILDYGPQGLKDTLAALQNTNIGYVGAGLNINKAQQPYIITKNGLKLAFFGFTDNEPGWIAGSEKPGINYVKVGDIETIKKMIAPVRDKVNLIIISMHWGPNMRQRPTQEFIEFAHQMIDAGADILHGHSAHVFQGIEIYNNKLIMYDTGDFVDDYMVTPELRNDLSFLFNVTVDKKGVKALDLIPTHINNLQVNKATGKDAEWALNRMEKLSAEFATNIKNGTWKR